MFSACPSSSWWPLQLPTTTALFASLPARPCRSLDLPRQQSTAGGSQSQELLLPASSEPQRTGPAFSAAPDPHQQQPGFSLPPIGNGGSTSEAPLGGAGPGRVPYPRRPTPWRPASHAP